MTDKNIIAFLVLSIIVILFASLFVFKADIDIVKQIITAMITGFTALITYFFTKHNPNGGDK